MGVTEQPQGLSSKLISKVRCLGYVYGTFYNERQSSTRFAKLMAAGGLEREHKKELKGGKLILELLGVVTERMGRHGGRTEKALGGSI